MLIYKCRLRFFQFPFLVFVSKSTLKNALLITLLPICVIACGKKDAPKPPELFAPDTVAYFQATGATSGITLTWQEPDSKANGDDLDDLSGFVVYKRLYDKEDPESFETLQEIAAIKPEPETPSGAAEPEKKPASPLERPASKPKAVQQYSLEDKDVKPGSQYEYYVAPENEEGVQGEPSGTLRITFIGESSIIERR